MGAIMSICAQIIGWGKCVPEQILTNDDMSRRVDTTDEWIRSRTGIAARRIAGHKETTATLAINAARHALEVANLPAARLDLIIVATVTPEYAAFPATACLVQDALGATHAGAFDLEAGCSGFVYALSLAAQVIRSGAQRNVLVIGSETLSRIIDWKDRNTCVLFGDGAGAVVLQAAEGEGGVLASVLGSDGSGADVLKVLAGGSRQPLSIQGLMAGEQFLRMDGREVYKFASRIIARATREALAAAQLKLEDLALLIPHQANVRIIEAATKDLGLDKDKVYVNLQRYGNTSSASIPIALCEAVQEGRLQPGDLLAMVGFGAGLTWGATVLRWGVPTPGRPVSRIRRLVVGLQMVWAKVRSTALKVWRLVGI
jgi:3-oxoacyl-[acyl-carrier-protein] synthase III